MVSHLCSTHYYDCCYALKWVNSLECNFEVTSVSNLLQTVIKRFYDRKSYCYKLHLLWLTIRCRQEYFVSRTQGIRFYKVKDHKIMKLRADKNKQFKVHFVKKQQQVRKNVNSSPCPLNLPVPLHYKNYTYQVSYKSKQSTHILTLTNHDIFNLVLRLLFCKQFICNTCD